jgi:hypothetical protein
MDSGRLVGLNEVCYLVYGIEAGLIKVDFGKINAELLFKKDNDVNHSQ